MKRRAESGFTLMELMIAITLVAALSLGMMMALRTSLQTLQKVDNRMQFNRRFMAANQILTRQIGGVMPVTTDCSSPGGSPARIATFRGTPESLRLVSSYSMTEGARGNARFLEYQVLPLQGGGYRLIVNEHLYTGPAATLPYCFDLQYRPAEVVADSFVLADRLVSCRFSYREQIPDQLPSEKWLPIWDRDELPAAVRIDMSPLDSSAALLPVTNITVPIHVTRFVRGHYEDGPN